MQVSVREASEEDDYRARLAIAGVVLFACLVLDSGKLGIATPMWRRQTPQRLFYMFGPSKGALLWGLDTGLMVTTYRVTSLTWAALALSFVGLLPWWSGVAYAAGFVIPSTVFILLVPFHTGADISEPHWVMNRIGKLRATRTPADARGLRAVEHRLHGRGCDLMRNSSGWSAGRWTQRETRT